MLSSISGTAASAVGKLNIGAIQDALKEGASGAEKTLKGGTEGVQEGMKKLFGR